jgi:nitroreductase
MLDIIKSRRSVRKFTSEPVTEQDVRDILDAAMQAPSANNEQAWQFVVLTGQMLEQYTQINRNTPRSATIAILVCGDLKASRADYYIQDCSAATQNMLLAIHAKGLGGVWTTVFPQALEPVRQLLGLPDHIIPFACVPIGRAATAPKQPTDRYNEKKIHHERW